VAIQLAYFFVPLPEPLGLPDGYIFRSFQPADWTAWEREAVRTAGSAPAPPPPEPTLKVSICLHHAEQRDTTAETVDTLIEIAQKAFPTLEISGADDRRASSSPTGTLTVAEIVVWLPEDVQKLDASDEPARQMDVLSTAFDSGLAALRLVQEAHYLTTRRPMTPCVRERLPMVIPFAVRVAEEDEPKPTWPSAISLFITRLDPTGVRVGFDDEQLRLFTSSVEALDPDRAFSTLPGLKNAATNALDAGQYLQAVVLVATACEVLLGDLLAHLLWEECATPDAAAEVMVRPFATKLTSEYHGRLGGRWTTTGGGPIAEYERQLLHVRHRAVHAGANPSLEEARSAFRAADHLEHFISDRLATSVRRYPITALAFCGRPGLQRRNALSRFVVDLMDDPTEVRWIETFGRWRVALTWRIAAMAGEQPSPNLQQAATALTIGIDGIERWWRVDRDAYVACAAMRPDLQPGHLSKIERMHEGVAAHPERGPISALFRDVTAEPVLPEKWLRLDQVLPLHFVMRDRSDLPGVGPPSLIANGRPERRPPTAAGAERP
jgi:hypothetical protein